MDRLKELTFEIMSFDLMSFVSGMKIPGVPELAPVADGRAFPRAVFPAHHFMWLSLLQQVEDGEVKRLMGLMPPGSAKSTYTSVVFPVHIMGRRKDTQVLVASYAGGLTRRWGRRARGLARQLKFRQIFRTELTKESAAAESFASRP
jgi:hypothetical protein